jgi:hypothetical protein
VNLAVQSAFLIIGALLLVSSVLLKSQIFAFIGLGLVLWGVLFLFSGSAKDDNTEVLMSTLESTLSSITSIISGLNHKGLLLGRGFYLPNKSRNCMIYIPSKDEIEIPKNLERNREQPFQNNPGGLYITSSGSSLVALFERKMGVSFSNVDLGYMKQNLPNLFVKDLQVLEEFEINAETGETGEDIHVKMVGSFHKDICGKLKKSSCELFSCPPCAAIAGILAKSIGKPVYISKTMSSNDSRKVDVWYHIIEG